MRYDFGVIMESTAYVPARGEVVSINLSPTGSAKSGHRAAVVLSPAQRNDRDGRAVLCPITNREKGGRYGVAIPEELADACVILVDQFKTMDWRQRNAELIARLPKETVAAVMRKLDILGQRLHRAGKLCALRNSGVPAAEAWRTVKPDTTANDRAAAEQARREIRWYHAQLERLYGKLCPGVAGRPCEKRVAARHTYCAACGAERRRLQRQEYNRNYYRLNREELIEDRRRRQRKAREREAAEMLAAIRRAAAEERRARNDAEAAAAAAARNEPPKMVDKHGDLVAAFNPETQKWEYTDQNRKRIGRW